MINPITYLVNAFWRFVFWWKKQTGWLDLDQTIEATGTILRVNVSLSGDGDIRFDLKLDSGQEWMITGFGGRLTYAEAAKEPSIHCEIVPWNRDKFDGLWQTLKPGMRVKVVGEWGFDGVHTGHSRVVDVILAIIRHQPNIHDGWFEIHPVEEIIILSE